MKGSIYFLFVIVILVGVATIFLGVQWRRQERIKQSTNLTLPTRWIVVKKEASLDFAEVFSFSLSPAAMEQFISQNYLSPNALLITNEPATARPLVQRYMRNVSSDMFMDEQLVDDDRSKWEAGADKANGRVVVVLYFADA